MTSRPVRDGGRLRLALIAGTVRPERCGVSHYTIRLAQGLRAAGLDATIVTTHAAARALPAGLAVGALDRWGLRALPALARAVRVLHPDLVHVQYAPASYRFHRAIALLPIALALSGWHGPLITTAHEYGGWAWEPALVPTSLRRRLVGLGARHGWWDRESGLLMSHSQAIVISNATALASLEAWLPGARERACEIPLCANIDVAPIARDQARADLRQRFGWPDGCPVLAFFGFLHPVKGLETLLDAFAVLRRAHSPARLLILGGTESLSLHGDQAAAYLDGLRAAARAAGIEDRLVFTGYLPAEEASCLLAGADLAVLPFNHGVTLKSGSLLALLAHGLPVVASASEPPEPVLADEGLARLAPPRAPAALAAALAALLGDPAQRERLARAGTAYVAHLNWPATVERHRALYAQLIAARAAPISGVRPPVPRASKPRALD